MRRTIFTCALDEAFQIPTEFSAELAVRTQQILAFESGIRLVELSETTQSLEDSLLDMTQASAEFASA